MRVETMGKILIAIGVIILLYATLAMPVSLRNSDIVNIHLISERQNTLILGGLLFLAGIVLFAVFKIKQTKEEEITAILKTEEMNRTIQDKLKNMSATGGGQISKLRKYFFKENETFRSNVSRFLFGLLFGAVIHDQIDRLLHLIIINIDDVNDNLINYEVARTLSNFTSITVAVFILLYAFRSKRKLLVFRNLLIVYLTLSAGSKLGGYSEAEGFPIWIEQDVLAILSIIFLIYSSFKLRIKSQ